MLQCLHALPEGSGKNNLLERTLKLVGCVLLMTGCSGQSAQKMQSETYAPFDDRPEFELTLQHDIAVVKGTVRHFNGDGSPVFHHFLPVATQVDRNTYLIAVDPSQVSLGTAQDVAGLARTAERFCQDTGYNLVSKGLSVFSDSDRMLLVEKCVPADVTLPPAYKVGDRAPRKLD